VKSQFTARVALTALAAMSSLTAVGQSRPEAVPSGSSVAEVAGVDPNKYLVGPQDLLFIRVWREPDFSLPVAVRPDGKISMPLLGEVEAAGQTPLQLTRTLTESLTKYLHNPDVTVFVTEVRSRKFYINGEVNRPGSFPLVTPTTVLEALSHAGGFREFANTRRIRVLRGAKVHYFNYNEVTNGKHLDQNIYLENGDQIIVR